MQNKVEPLKWFHYPVKRIGSIVNEGNPKWPPRRKRGLKRRYMKDRVAEEQCPSKRPPTMGAVREYSLAAYVHNGCGEHPTLANYDLRPQSHMRTTSDYGAVHGKGRRFVDHSQFSP